MECIHAALNWEAAGSGNSNWLTEVAPSISLPDTKRMLRHSQTGVEDSEIG